MRAFTIQIEVRAQTIDELDDVKKRLAQELTRMYGNANDYGLITSYELPQPVPTGWGWTQDGEPGFTEQDKLCTCFGGPVENCPEHGARDTSGDEPEAELGGEG